MTDLFMRRLSIRLSARRQRAAKHRLEVLLGDEDWAAFERLREERERREGRRVSAADVIRHALRVA
jgi:hypothetical protein